LTARPVRRHRSRAAWRRHPIKRWGYLDSAEKRNSVRCCAGWSPAEVRRRERAAEDDPALLETWL